MFSGRVGLTCRTSPDQGHLFAMEVSSGEEYYIASDNTGTPLAVFSSNGQMIKQVLHIVSVSSLIPAVKQEVAPFVFSQYLENYFANVN